MSDRRIFVVNPNSSEWVTMSMDAALAPLKVPAGRKIECVTLRSGPAAIESDEDVANAAPLVQEFVSKNEASAGAFVVACFSHPELGLARKTIRVPVFGMAESGFLTALTRAERFGVVSILECSIPRHRRYIRTLGIESRQAGDLPLGLGVGELSESRGVKEKLIAVGSALTRSHGADVLVLGGTRRLSRRLRAGRRCTGRRAVAGGGGLGHGDGAANG